MSSQDFPTYGRGEDPGQPDPTEGYAKPVPYQPDFPTYTEHPNQPAPPQPSPGQPQPVPRQPYQVPGQPQQVPGPAGFVPGQPQQVPGTAQLLPGQPGYAQPPAYRPGSPYGTPAHPQQHQLPTYGRDEASQPRDPRVARVLLIAAITAGLYGFLVLTVQRVSLREISQAPGSPLNHPLRTDVIDTLGQLLLILIGGAAIGLWVRDLLARRKVGRQPPPREVVGLALVAVSLIPLLIWFLMVLSTGLGSNDETLHRLPTAYGWGGTGLVLLTVGLSLGYRQFKPAGTAVVQRPPDRPPWE